jgi:hypothetical protein
VNRYSLAMDRNGNRILRVKPPQGRGFSIQTLGNLPATHHEGVTIDTHGSVVWWVTKYGTPRQKRVMGVE